MQPKPAPAANPARWLKTLGRLPRDFNGERLLPFLTNPSEKVRQLAAINLGKLKDKRYLPALLHAAQTDTSSAVRREAAAAIGRLKDAATIPALSKLAQDEDPKVIMQALRALLQFPKNKTLHETLNGLKNHPNEMLQSIIARERAYYFQAPAAAQSAQHAHITSPNFMKNVIVNGDVQQVLKLVPKESVHLTFTSPPYYNARDYSIYSSYADYLKFLQKVFKAVHRITKPGRFLVLNTSPVIVPRISRAHASRRYPIPFDIHPLLVKMGWEFIDDIVWVKPESAVKNRNGGFYQHRKPLAYKPNACTEYLFVYRKASQRLLDWNIRQYPPAAISKSRVTGAYESRNVWEIDPTFDKTHSAVFPAKLCQRVIAYYSMAGDLIFDPFGGSGTLGLTASTLDRFFFMTEQSLPYIKRMQERFAQHGGGFFTPANFVSVEKFAKMRREK